MEPWPVRVRPSGGRRTDPRRATARFRSTPLAIAGGTALRGGRLRRTRLIAPLAVGRWGSHLAILIRSTIRTARRIAIGALVAIRDATAIAVATAALAGTTSVAVAVAARRVATASGRIAATARRVTARAVAAATPTTEQSGRSHVRSHGIHQGEHHEPREQDTQASFHPQSFRHHKSVPHERPPRSDRRDAFCCGSKSRAAMVSK